MAADPTKRARGNIRRGKFWEAQVADDLAGRRTVGAGSDGRDYYGRPYEAKRRKVAPCWFWKAYENSLTCDGFAVGGLLFLRYKDGLRYMSKKIWRFPKVLLLHQIDKRLPRWLAKMMEQAATDVAREHPGEVPRVALHIDQWKPGVEAMELWIFPKKELMNYV